MAGKTIIVQGWCVAVVLASGLVGPSFFTDSQKAQGVEHDQGLKVSFLICVLACAFGFLILPISGRAQVLNFYTVNTTSDSVVPNACHTAAAGCSLRGAIMAANASGGDDDIVFAIPASDPFCFAGTCTINLTTALPNISANISFFGPGADKLTLKPAPGVNIRVFTVFSALVNINKCTISGNPGSPGGGIEHSGGTINVTNSVISGSSASSGGAIVMTSFGTLNLIDSTISGNIAGNGGGIFSVGTLNIINSTITDNLSINSDGAGGGIYGHTGTVNVTNSTVTGNAALNGGGGIFANLGTTVNVKNTIIALNGGAGSPDVKGIFVSAGFNLIGKRDGSTGFTAATDQTGTAAVPLNPMLDPAGLQNNGGLTRTIALLSISPAIDKGTSSGLMGNLSTDQRGTGFRRTFDNPGVANAAGGDGTDIGAFERRGNTAADFDGDGKTDIGIFRPSVAEWWVNRSSDAATFATQFGATPDKVAPADFTGDGKTDIAVWRPSTGFWFVLRSEDFSFFAFPFGTNGDIPVPADYDTDGKADAAVFRPSSATWFIRRSSNGGTTVEAFGLSGDQPVPADYDGDGRADIAIYRPSNGQWWLNRSTAGLIGTTFGNSSDKPVQGDYTGDGKSDIAFWRPSTGEWYVLRSEDDSFFALPFGTSGDIPAPGDYDGDGRFDATVFRPSSATWFSQRTSVGPLIQQFGTNGDRPIPNAFVP